MTSRSEALWWKMLKEKDLLEMSFILAQNALPAWKNFNHSAITKQELASLPENALREIEAMLKGFGSSPKLNEHFNSFVPPVVNIRDGYLKYPYEVKLVFLSVFHILKGIISNDVKIARQAFVSVHFKSYRCHQYCRYSYLGRNFFINSKIFFIKPGTLNYLSL